MNNLLLIIKWLIMFTDKILKFLKLYEGIAQCLKGFRKVWEQIKKYWDKEPDSEKEKEESEHCWKLIEVVIMLTLVVLCITGVIVL